MRQVKGEYEFVTPCRPLRGSAIRSDCPLSRAMRGAKFPDRAGSAGTLVRMPP
jgi:hypothetical protein